MQALRDEWIDVDAAARDYSLVTTDPSHQRLLRSALGCFPTGVTIVTTCDENGRLYGVTASSFNSVSLDPPIVLWSQQLSAPSHGAFKRAPFFGVNILGDTQEALSLRFSRPALNKFEQVDYHLTEEGIPLIEGVVAQFVCRNDFRSYGGDHAVFFGSVVRFGYSKTAAPLIYSRGRCLTQDSPARWKPGESAAH
ncbi:FMN reductase (NADH) NtaB [Castellaniella defragrans]